MNKGRITQEKFNELYIAYRNNFNVYADLELTFEMVMMLHRVNGIEFKDRMNEIDINPPEEIEKMFMTPNVIIEEHDKAVDSGREKVIDSNGDDYEYGDLKKAVDNYMDDEPWVDNEDDDDPSPVHRRYDDDDSNEY